MGQLPEIPLQDFALGLASAGVFLWILLVLTRTRSLDETWADPRRGAQGGDPLFASFASRRPGVQLNFLFSLFGHICVIALVPWLQLFLPEALPFNFQRYDMIIVQFRMQDAPFRIPKDIQDQIKAARAARENREIDRLAADLDDPGIGDGRESSPGEAPPERAELEILLPRQEQPKDSALEAAQLEIETALAELKAFEGTREAVSEFSTPDIESIPNPGIPALAELNLAQAPELKLTDSPNPIFSDQDPLRDMRPALADVVGGGPLVHLGADDFSALLAVAEGSGDGAFQLGAALRAGALGPSAAGGAAGGEGNGASGDDGDGLGLGLNGLSPVPRKLHGIILIASQIEAIPEAAGVLTGNPVYTVYLDVPGFARKWIFQVCVPEVDNSALEYAGGALRVLPNRRVDPPYAFSKLAPEIDFERLQGDGLPPRIVIYAKFDENGDMGDTRIVTGVDPDTDNTILASLQSWEFHPAFRDGRPVAVEALFGIPLR